VLLLVECGMMPRGNRPRVPADDVTILRDWIAGGAKPFTPESSDEYALRHILIDQRAGRGSTRDRYFAFNHLAADNPNDAHLFAEALTTALNLLTWKSDPVRPVAVDPLGTIFRVDLGRLGWDVKPFESKTVGKADVKSDANLFDLVLLEYPYAALPAASPAFDAL